MDEVSAPDMSHEGSVPAHSPRVMHLLDVARAAFTADGFDAVSIDGIARASGVSKETIYRHFPDKRALFRAALEELAGRFTSRAAALHKAAATAGEELQDLARAIMDSAVDGGLLSPLWLSAGLGTRMPDFAEELQRAQAERMEPVRRALEAADAARGIRRTVPMEDALDFGSLAVEGPTLLMGFAAPDDERRGHLARRVAQLFDHGVLAIPTAPVIIDPPLGDGPEPAKPLPAHLRRLLDVAATHFLAQGFEVVSLADIGAEARVGRGTLYRHFASKAGLFDAVLRDLVAQVVAQAAVPPLRDDGWLEDVSRFLAGATANLTGALSIALHRVAISTSRRDPALARMVHEDLRRPWITPLAGWISARTGQADATWLARQAIVLAIQGNRAIAAGRGPEPESHARRAAMLFLHGHAALGAG
ncbi:MAG: hypothetical protein RIS85_210 [Pseudomonadota bacterium]